ncbi:MAG: serine/threonine protein kinase, partial [Ramlibacter sp.]|nr:serine/threonine protein kinase [Ramlibacter sp.]
MSYQSHRTGEILYTSLTTQVRRSGAASDAHCIVFKEYLGPDADRNLGHEKAVLQQLAGLDGVVQLAPQSGADGVLALTNCAGVSLEQVLMSGAFDMGAALSIAIGVARALEAVHRAGVIHLDVNPANIVVSAQGKPTLIDFGLAIFAEQQTQAAPGGRLVGTLRYLSPEQTGRTGRVLDQRADLYGLGVTIYEMVTGRPPFEALDPLRLVYEHLVREPVAPSQIDARVPRLLSDLILRLLAKEPERRYQSAEGLLYDLERVRDLLVHGKSEAAK